MSEDKHAERLARIKKIVAETDSRFEVVEPSPGVIQVRDNGAIFEGFTLRDYETGDYEVAVRKLVRALAEGMYPGSMFMEMMEQNRLTL